MSVPSLSTSIKQLVHQHYVSLWRRESKLYLFMPTKHNCSYTLNPKHSVLSSSCMRWWMSSAPRYTLNPKHSVLSLRWWNGKLVEFHQGNGRNREPYVP